MSRSAPFTTEDLRYVYARGGNADMLGSPGDTIAERYAAFDAWLSRVKVAAFQEGWIGCSEWELECDKADAEARPWPDMPDNPYGLPWGQLW